jgi:hypothetical protein
MEPGMNNEIIDSSKMMMNIMGNSLFMQTDNVGSVWKRVVSKIRNFNDDENNDKHMPIGERLAGNTRVIDLKKGILLVEVDHPGWVQYLRMYQKFIITGIKRELPELKINTMAFRQTGSSARLNDDYEERLANARKQFSQKLDEQDKEIEEFLAKNNSNNKTKE